MELWMSKNEPNTPPTPDSPVYKVLITRLGEYNEILLQSHKILNSVQSLQLKSDKDEKNIDLHISSAVTMSSVVVTTGIVAMAYFKLGVFYTVLICIFVIAILVIGYAHFVYPLSSSFYQTLFTDDS